MDVNTLDVYAPLGGALAVYHLDLVSSTIVLLLSILIARNVVVHVCCIGVVISKALCLAVILKEMRCYKTASKQQKCKYVYHAKIFPLFICICLCKVM